MSCNFEIHQRLNELGYMYYDFCDLQIDDKILKQDEPCFNNKELITEEYMEVCNYCGQVNGIFLSMNISTSMTLCIEFKKINITKKIYRLYD